MEWGCENVMGTHLLLLNLKGMSTQALHVIIAKCNDSVSLDL